MRRRRRWLVVGIGGMCVLLGGYWVVDRVALDGEGMFRREGTRNGRPPTSLLHSSTSPLHSLPIDINVHLTQFSSPPTVDPTEKFLAYSPHSGYHNQRSSLENALTLAYMLNRTLLLPPVWLGHAIPYIAYDKLQRRLDIADKEGLDRCNEMGEGGSQDYVPRECEGFWDWTRVSWGFMVDLRQVEKVVRLRDRWNLTREWMEDELGIGEGDRYEVRDDRMYQYRYYDDEDDGESLAKYENKVVVSQLEEASRDYKLVQMGSLFGTSRVRTTREDNFDARSVFRKSMVFKNDLLDRITTTIRDRLGGDYYGLHLRVGDGVFQKGAEGNMASIWRELCEVKMKVAPDVCASIVSTNATITRQPRRIGRRSLSTKQSNSRPQRPGAYHHPPLPPPIHVTSRSNSPLDSSLSCRRPLHIDPSFLPFNTPLFIATDSKMPASDSHLALFLRAFPCTFFLNDFSSLSPLNTAIVTEMDELRAWRGSGDKVPLAQFHYPQLDASIAAWGRVLIGTPGSTYSSFAVDVLHQVYQ
jgi:hypothetical protein